LGEEIVALIKPGRFLKKEDSSQKLFKIMDHHSSVTKATFAIRDCKVGIGGNSKRQKYKRKNKDPNHSNDYEDDESDVPYRRKKKGTSLPKAPSEKKRKMTESLEKEKNNSKTSVTRKGSNQRSKPSIPKNIQDENNESSDLSDSDLESKASSRTSLGSKKRLKKGTTSSSTANQSPRKAVHHLKRIYAHKNLSDDDDDDDDDDHSDVKVIDLVPKLQSPFKRLKSISPSSHKQEPKFAIPFRGYGFPLTVFIRTLTLVTENPTESANESITEGNDFPNLSDIDFTASKELVALKHLKLRPL
jgi:hypothetical protein